MPVPITKETRTLFGNSATAMEEEAMDLYAAVWSRRFKKKVVESISSRGELGGLFRTSDMKTLVSQFNLKESVLYYRRTMQSIGLIGMEEKRNKYARGYEMLKPVSFSNVGVDAGEYIIHFSEEEVEDWKLRNALAKLPVEMQEEGILL